MFAVNFMFGAAPAFGSIVVAIVLMVHFCDTLFGIIIFSLLFHYYAVNVGYRNIAEVLRKSGKCRGILQCLESGYLVSVKTVQKCPKWSEDAAVTSRT